MIASARMVRRSGGKTCEIAEERLPDDADEPADADGGADAGAPVSLAQRLDVTGTQVCASTLASVSAAAVASIFGVTGTIVGAAVMSVIATTGSALYSHGIRRTGARLQQTPVAEVTRRLGPWPRADAEPTAAASRDASPAATAGPGSPSPSPSHGRSTSLSAGWREWLSHRRWGVAAGVAVVFVATLGVVTLVELAGQRSLAGIAGDDSGRTSIGSFLDGSGSSSDDQAPGATSTTVAPGDDPAVTDDPASSTDPGSSDGPSTTDGGASSDPSTPTTGQDEPSPTAQAPSSPGDASAG